MKTNEVGKRYVQLCKEGKNLECLDTLFAPSAVSVEAAKPASGGERVANGLAAVRAKGQEWAENHTVHGADVQGPYPHDDRFAVKFVYDVTNKPSGMRMKMEEVGVFTVVDGKITREEFFYSLEG